MKQVVKKNIDNKDTKKTKKKVVTSQKSRKKHRYSYGTSQLELDFAKKFLDANDIPYIYQYEAKSIGRFYDFAIIEKKQDNQYITEEKEGLKSVKQDNFVKVAFFIEVDGDYW